MLFCNLIFPINSVLWAFSYAQEMDFGSNLFHSNPIWENLISKQVLIFPSPFPKAYVNMFMKGSIQPNMAAQTVILSTRKAGGRDHEFEIKVSKKGLISETSEKKKGGAKGMLK